MDRITCLDEYYTLVKAAKKGLGATATNCILFPKAIQRYIDLGRFYYEEVASGVFLYSDEERYYQGYYFLNPGTPFCVEKKNKSVLIQNIRAKDKNAKNLLIENRLGETGFEFADTMQMIKYALKEVSPKTMRLWVYAKQILEREGFVLRRITESDFDAVWALLEETPEIPYYTIPYYTTEELKQHCEMGFVVGIFSADGELCAVNRTMLEGKTTFGWVAVKREYQRTYGMVLVFDEYLSRLFKGHGYNLSGWIDVNNKPSIQYHTRKGCIFLDRYVDRWILNRSAE